MKLSNSGVIAIGLTALPAAYGSVIQRAAAIANVPPQAWTAFNLTVGGRLGVGTPYGTPCFSKYKGSDAAVNSAACADRSQNVLEERYRLGVFGSAMMTQFESCPPQNSYCSLDGLNSTNATPYQAPANCGQGSIAPYYVAVKQASDVMLTFGMAKMFNLPITIKNTGHDYAGRSHGPNSLSLWMHNLQDITRNQTFVANGCAATTATDAVTIGAGVHWEKTYQWAEANNVTVLGGACPSVGSAGGWLQGGGHGALSNQLGLGVDRVLQFKIVTPDGVLRYANACQNTDLFYALRGGGPGTWGVVLEVTYKLDPKYKLQVYSFSFADATPERIRAYTKVIIDNSVRFAEDGWGGYIQKNGIQFANLKLTPAQATASLKPLIDYVATIGTPISGVNSVFEVPSFYKFESGYVGPTVENGLAGLLGGSTGRFIQKKNFETAETRAQLLEAMLQVYSRTVATAIMFTTPYNFKPVPDATSVHPGWRTAVWSVLALNIGWSWDTNATQLKANYQELTAVGDLLRKITPWSDAGVYINESDMYEPDWQNAYFGSNYAKLLAIKKKYDPNSVLDCFRCVGWKGVSDSRYQCYV